MKIDHIGYLTKDINKSIVFFTSPAGGGFHQTTDVIKDDQSSEEKTAPRNVYLCFLRNEQGYTIELVSPMQETSSVTGLLAKQGEGPYHICYQTKKIHQSIEQMKKDGWILVKAPAPAVAFQGAPVAFLFRNGIGLIELVERNAPDSDFNAQAKRMIQSCAPPRKDR